MPRDGRLDQRAANRRTHFFRRRRGRPLTNRIVYDLVQVIEGECRLKQALIRDKRVDGLFLLPAAQPIAFSSGAASGRIPSRAAR